MRKSICAGILVIGSFLVAASGVAQEANKKRTNVFEIPQPVVTPPVGPRVNPPSPLDTLKFNGLMKAAGVVSVSIYDSKENRNYWLEQGKEVNGLRLVNYRAEEKVAVISRGGVSRSLPLSDVKIEELKISPNQAGPGTTPPVPQVAARTATGVDTADGETDQQVRERMQKVAEEIRRRRAERRARIQESRNN